MNVNIWDDVNDASQWWGFEKVSGGYVVRNMMNPNCVLSISGVREIIISTYIQADHQIWSIQNTVTFDANGGTGAPAVQFKNYEEAINLSNAVPVRKGYTFLGWATSVNDTQVSYQPGAEYNKNENVTLFALWEENVSVTKIEIHAAPSKVTYTIGEHLDTTGLEIKVHYSNGKSEVVNSGFEVTGFDANTEGNQTVIVTYSGEKTDFSVTVAPKAMLGDANGDRKLSYQDALMVLRASIGLEVLDAAVSANCDVNEDGKLNYQDALYILRASIGLPN